MHGKLKLRTLSQRCCYQQLDNNLFENVRKVFSTDRMNLFRDYLQVAL